MAAGVLFDDLLAPRPASQSCSDAFLAAPIPPPATPKASQTAKASLPKYLFYIQARGVWREYLVITYSHNYSKMPPVAAVPGGGAGGQSTFDKSRPA